MPVAHSEKPDVGTKGGASPALVGFHLPIVGMLRRLATIDEAARWSGELAALASTQGFASLRLLAAPTAGFPRHRPPIEPCVRFCRTHCELLTHPTARGDEIHIPPANGRLVWATIKEG